MKSIYVWLADPAVAHDKPGMGGYRDVYYPGDTAFVSYSDYIWISKIGK